MLNPPVSRLIQILGRNKIAQHCGIKTTSVTSWHNHGVPPKYCKQLEELTQGQVTAHELRPDIFKQPTAAGTKA